MKNVAILFPGQGAQYTGMGKHLYEQYHTFQKICEEASEYAGFNVAELCFSADSEMLKQTEYTQPIILILGYAASRILTEEYGIQPDIVAGHSLGEITAATYTGRISLKDAVKLVRLRGRYMQDAVEQGVGAMSVVLGLEATVVNSVCDNCSTKQSIVQISNKNSLEQTVIAGHLACVIDAEQQLRELGAKIIRLNVSAPFHCELMKPVEERFRTQLNQITIRPSNIPIVSCITGIPYLKESDIKDIWVYQLTHPVEWVKCMKYMIGEGITTFIDAGPNNTMKKLCYANGYGFQAVSLDKDELAFEKV